MIIISDFFHDINLIFFCIILYVIYSIYYLMILILILILIKIAVIIWRQLNV